MENLFSGNDDICNTIETYADMVVRIAFQNTRNQSDAEDIAQEVFIKLLKRPAFSDEGHQKAWLIRVTVNQCRDLRRSFWHRRVVALPDPRQTFSEEDRETFLTLWTLPKNYRNVLYLYYYEEYTVPEIAEILQRNENTVYSWLQRAKKRLKTILEEGENEF